jgi:2-polyprenyl-3-methyl-5-hydroxy-6-metoxy-1,4-benzoquinol methylase
MSDSEDLAAEAEAFNQRIAERKSAGYVPDLRRAVKCDFFYKSFWRDPYFVRLYAGAVFDVLLDLLSRHGRQGMRIADIGCGPGYYSLEMARNGFHVTAIDIAEKAIRAARETLESSPKEPGFGSLDYRVASMDQLGGQYDAVIFTGVIHHFGDPGSVVEEAMKLLSPGGLLICYEPCHERWRQADAAIVALIRSLLSATGNWYEPELAKATLLPQGWESLTAEVHEEYLTERDKSERYQSPNDNASSGERILEALRGRLDELEFRNQFSFIYRLLGGLRGPDATVQMLADLIAQFDRFAVDQGHMQPNTYFWAGRKR